MVCCKIPITDTVKSIYKREAKKKGLSLQDYMAELLCKGFSAEMVGNRSVLTTD